jgi:O-antigen ligase
VTSEKQVGDIQMASRSKRHGENRDLLDRHAVRANIFSPFVLADRAAFIVLVLYFVFWPIWYVSEDKLSARAGEFRIEHLIVAVIFVLSLGTLSRRWSRTPGSWALFLLVGYGAFTLIWSPNVKEGLLLILNLTSIFIFTEVLARNPGRQRIARLSFLVGLAVMTAIGVSRAETPTAKDFRLLFPAGIDPNQLAVQIAMGIIILTAVIVSDSGGGRIRYIRFWSSLTLGLLFAGVVVLSGSRTGILAVIAGSSLLLLLQKDSSGKLRVWHRRLAWVPALALVGILGVQPLMASKSASLVERYEEGFFKGDLAGRDMVWRAGVRYFSSSGRNVLIGGGIGSFDESVVDYLDRPLYQVALQMAAVNPYRLGPSFAPHDDLLRVACDLGIIGLVLFVAFYIQLGLACVSTASAAYSATLPLALLATVVVGGMALDLISFPVYPIALALIIAPCARTHAWRAKSIQQNAFAHSH